MTTTDTTAPLDWELRMQALWTTYDEHDGPRFRELVETLTSELPADHPIGLFERGCAHDSTGEPVLAAKLYRQALKGGLSEQRRRRAVIQLASSLRNLGELDASAALLTKERNEASDELDDAVIAFLALTLVDQGRAREATALALEALSRRLPRYSRSLARYAKALIEA